MKVSINSPVIDGAYGGGMSFVVQLNEYLKNKGVKVINHLNDNDIDIILHLNVTYTYSYSFYKAFQYKTQHPEVRIVHRVGDSGLQRPHSFMAKTMTLCSSSSDHLVYVSSWLKEVMYSKLKDPVPYSIIMNGVDQEKQKAYSLQHKAPWDGRSKLKIVTHHWSSNYDKGHYFYQILDSLLANADYRDKYEFTYIGNYPKNLKYRNTNLIPAMQKEELMEEISRHHVYLTGSKNEASGNHALEGISLGLPILYYESGGIPEYAYQYGLRYKKGDFESQLAEIRKEYFKFIPIVKNSDFSGIRMSDQYLTLFENLLRKKDLSEAKSNFGKIINFKLLFLILKGKSLILYPLVYALKTKLSNFLKINK